MGHQSLTGSYSNSVRIHLVTVLTCLDSLPIWEYGSKENLHHIEHQHKSWGRLVSCILGRYHCRSLGMGSWKGQRFQQLSCVPLLGFLLSFVSCPFCEASRVVLTRTEMSIFLKQMGIHLFLHVYFVYFSSKNESLHLSTAVYSCSAFEHESHR